jgi:hypothetical protein
LFKVAVFLLSITMRKYHLYIIILINLCSNILHAQQNLISDPSMENYHYIPIGPNPCNADSMLVSSDWYDPNGASSDWMTYVNTLLCPSLPYPGVPQNIFGWQWPKDGDAYWHFGFSYHETAIDTHTQGICAICTIGFYDSRASILCEFLC